MLNGLSILPTDWYIHLSSGFNSCLIELSTLVKTHFDVYLSAIDRWLIKV